MSRSLKLGLAALAVVAAAWGCGADLDDTGRGGGLIERANWIESSSGRLPLGAPPESVALSSEALAEVRRGVGAVRASGCGPDGRGTAFAIAPGLALTAAHVVAGATQVQVALPSSAGPESVHEVEVVGFSPERDLALLGGDFPLMPLRLGKARLGAQGAVVGFLQAADERLVSESDSGPKPNLKVSPARIEHLVRAGGLWGDEGDTGGDVARNTYVLAAEVRTGQSGAPLVDRNANAVGVTFATAQGAGGIGFALSRGEVLGFLNSVGVDARIDYRGETVIEARQAGLTAISTGECKLG